METFARIKLRARSSKHLLADSLVSLEAAGVELPSA